jgi:hypothetical protein
MVLTGKREREMMIAMEGSGGKVEVWAGWEKYRWQIRIQREKNTLLCAIKVHRRWREAVTCGDVGP